MIMTSLKVYSDNSCRSKVLDINLKLITNNSIVLPITDGFSLPFSIKSLLYFLDPTRCIEEGCPCPSGWFLCHIDSNGYVRSLNKVGAVKKLNDSCIGLELYDPYMAGFFMDVLYLNRYSKDWILLIPEK